MLTMGRSKNPNFLRRYLWMATKCVNKSGVTDRLGDEAEIATLLVLSTIELRGLTPI